MHIINRQQRSNSKTRQIRLEYRRFPQRYGRHKGCSETNAVKLRAFTTICLFRGNFWTRDDEKLDIKILLIFLCSWTRCLRTWLWRAHSFNIHHHQHRSSRRRHLRRKQESRTIFSISNNAGVCFHMDSHRRHICSVCVEADDDADLSTTTTFAVGFAGTTFDGMLFTRAHLLNLDKEIRTWKIWLSICVLQRLFRCPNISQTVMVH